MSDSQVLRAWEERVILHEKGNRLVHYILKDSIGNSLLAVVGREKSINHMTYVISEDFLRVFGSTSSVHAGTKWRARRDVVEWLVSIVSKGGPISANSTNPSSLKFQVNHRKSSIQEVEGSSPEESAPRASKRIKICRVNETLKSFPTGMTNLVSAHTVVKWEPTRKRLKFKLSNEGPAVIKLVHEPQCQLLSKFPENIELLSQDSGLRGCWFRCKILNKLQNCLKVQYKDVFEVDGARNVEEWVPASRVAGPDKLCVRCEGRLTVRPSPCEESPDITFEVGAAVDAWWCNGWWEGVVIGYDTMTKCKLQVYFPCENRFLTVARKNIRVSRDWIDEKWVNIKPKHDLLFFLSSIFNTGPKLPPIPILTEANSCTRASRKNLSPQKAEEPEDDKLRIPSSCRDPKGVEELNLKRRIILRYNEEISQRSCV